jgi:hypothetical protein
MLVLAEPWRTVFPWQSPPAAAAGRGRDASHVVCRASLVPSLSSIAHPRHHITSTHPPTALQFHSRRPCTVCILSTTCFLRSARLLPPPPAVTTNPTRTPSRPTRCFALFAFLPRPPVCRLHTHTRTRKRTRSSPLILIASSARAHKPSRPTPHLSPPPVANRSRQAAPFLHSTSYPKPDTQASPGVDSIEQEAVNHTAATTSVHLVAPHTDRQRFPHQ